MLNNAIDRQLMYNSLEEIQRAMSDYILHGRFSPLLEEVIDNGRRNISPRNRCNVYRNNVTISLLNALGAEYPVVTKIVGVQKFNSLVVDYISQYPPSNEVLHYYGFHFPEFISYQDCDKAVPYLYDLAMLEREVHKASYAISSSPLSIERLAAYDIASENDQIYLKLNECVSLISSKFQINQIRNNIVEQGGVDYKDHIVDDYLMITRIDGSPAIFSIDKVEYEILGYLRKGKGLDESCQRAAECCDGLVEDIDLTNLLAKHFRIGTFVGISHSKFKAQEAGA